MPLHALAAKRLLPRRPPSRLPVPHARLGRHGRAGRRRLPCRSRHALDAGRFARRPCCWRALCWRRYCHDLRRPSPVPVYNGHLLRLQTFRLVLLSAGRGRAAASRLLDAALEVGRHLASSAFSWSASIVKVSGPVWYTSSTTPNKHSTMYAPCPRRRWRARTCCAIPVQHQPRHIRRQVHWPAVNGLACAWSFVPTARSTASASPLQRPLA